MADTTTTTDHDTIVTWTEARHGRPAKVTDTSDGDGDGMIRLAFGQDNADLTEIEWDEWLGIFDDRQLALLHSTEDGNQFNKLVSR